METVMQAFNHRPVFWTVLKMQMQNTDLFCAMQSVVHDIAMSHPRPYYKTITLEEGCN